MFDDPRIRKVLALDLVGYIKLFQLYGRTLLHAKGALYSHELNVLLRTIYLLIFRFHLNFHRPYKVIQMTEKASKGIRISLKYLITIRINLKMALWVL